jgi:hypothetical protein
MISRIWTLVVIVMLSCAAEAYGQIQPCPDPVPQTVGKHTFRRAGDIVTIPVTVGDCQPVALDLRWTNGPNNGSNFVVTFLDENEQPIFSQLVYGFMTGNREYPFFGESQPWMGNGGVSIVPASVQVQAVQPYANPVAISYRVSRAPSRHPQAKKVERIDEKFVADLRSAAGRLLVDEHPSESLSYQLEEIQLSAPRELEIRGRTESVDRAFRLTVKGGDVSSAALIWIDDAPLPAVWSYERRNITAVIFDSSILRDGAEISISNPEGRQLRSSSERLRIPANLRVATATSDASNSVVAIRRATRTIGANRYPTVQIELRSSRPVPARETPLQLQVGKRFFLEELSGDASGKTLMLTLTPEVFAELKDGAEIVAFFNRPDRSGASDQNLWRFARLNKSMLEK